jgi:hypothetical protein
VGAGAGDIGCTCVGAVGAGAGTGGIGCTCAGAVGTAGTGGIGCTCAGAVGAGAGSACAGSVDFSGSEDSVDPPGSAGVPLYPTMPGRRLAGAPAIRPTGAPALAG